MLYEVITTSEKEDTEENESVCRNTATYSKNQKANTQYCNNRKFDIKL